jgi:hypothetical protein
MKKTYETFVNCENENIWFWYFTQQKFPYIENKREKVGRVNLKRYRITVELIEDDESVLQERLQNLWDCTLNPHELKLIKKEANKLGFVLKNTPGSKWKSDI